MRAEKKGRTPKVCCLLFLFLLPFFFFKWIWPLIGLWLREDVSFCCTDAIAAVKKRNLAHSSYGVSIQGERIYACDGMLCNTLEEGKKKKNSSRLLCSIHFKHDELTKRRRRLLFLWSFSFKRWQKNEPWMLRCLSVKERNRQEEAKQKVWCVWAYLYADIFSPLFQLHYLSIEVHFKKAKKKKKTSETVSRRQ